MSGDVSSDRTARKVYDWMASRGVEVDVSIRRVAEGAGIGRTTAQRALRRLVQLGWIVEVYHGTGDQYPTVWRIIRGGD